MAQHLNPFSGRQFLDANGDPYSGAKLFIYEAGSSTKYTTTKDEAGLSNHANPIILNSRGEPADGASAAQAIWQSDGDSVKLVLAPSTDTDPPVAAISTWDDIEGINDAVSTTASQWLSGPAPTFVDADTFTLIGDQTSEFHVGRRLKFSVTAGTVYGTITASAYTSLTTIDVSIDSGSLDSGLSAVWYGLLTETNHSIPFGAAYTAQGQIEYGSSNGISALLNIGTAGQHLGVNQAGTLPTYITPRKIYGLIISNDSGDTTNDILVTAGGIFDSTKSYFMEGAQSVKRIDAGWAAGSGNGGFPSGITLTNDTWYRFFAIFDITNNLVDYGFDSSGSAANLLADATDYTKYAHVGWVYYGTATIDQFRARELSSGAIEYLWTDPPLDVDATQTNTASRDLYTLTVPPSVSTAILNIYHTGASEIVLVKDPNTTDEAPSLTAAPLATGSSTARHNGNFHVRVSDTSEVSVRTTVNPTTIRIATLGFIQERY